ncbi:MAG: peptidoglycan-binding protein [Actinomycetota bacterium]|nr:peptidoglycan-binding protein [Actinomycetota bacterium]
MRDWLTHHDWCTKQAWPRKGLSFWAAGRQTRPFSKIVLHSTETVGFPGYADGAAAPHFTISMRTGQTRQHVPLSYGSRALTLAGTRLANVAGVIQIEIIGAVTPGYPDKHGHYDLPRAFPTDPDAQHYLARLLAAIHVETEIPLTEDVDWVTYPASSGRYAPQRQRTEAQFLAYRGVLGHQHVVGNEHGDPGALPVASVILPQARAIVTGSAKPASVTPPAPAPATPGRAGDVFFEGSDGTDVHAWQADLHLLYSGLPGAGVFGPKTTALTKQHQSALGVTADGRVGPATLTTHKEYLMSLEAKIDQLLTAAAQAPAPESATLETAVDPLIGRRLERIETRQLEERAMLRQIAIALTRGNKVGDEAGAELDELIRRTDPANDAPVESTPEA